MLSEISLATSKCHASTPSLIHFFTTSLAKKEMVLKLSVSNLGIEHIF
ncbi:hypothetical protein [Sharpea porci]|nr:hypothetical protein [Sharpea porci]MDY5279488.1 hypothetical protein [Sharpea porci]